MNFSNFQLNVPLIIQFFNQIVVVQKDHNSQSTNKFITFVV